MYINCITWERKYYSLKKCFLIDIVVIILHTFCSFGGITINTDVEKCESNEDFERKLACKFIISEGLY